MFNSITTIWLLISLLFISSPIFGQQNVESTNKVNEIEATKTGTRQAEERDVRKSFDTIRNLVKQGKWSDVSNWMTKQAQDELVIEQIISAIGLTKIEMPIPLPQFEDAIDEVENVIIKYELDKLNIDTSAMFKFSLSMGEEEDTAEDENPKSANADKTTMTEQTNKILKHVDQMKKRWEIVGELWNAKKSSPFTVSPLAGSIEKLERGENGNYHLQIKVGASPSDNDSGVMIQMASPPVVVKMVNQDGKWKLDGRDQQRSEKLMRDFLKNQPMMSSPQRQDF